VRSRSDRLPTKGSKTAPPTGAQPLDLLERKPAHLSVEHPSAGMSVASARTQLLRAQSSQLTPAKVIALQRTVGNRAVQHHLGSTRAAATGAAPVLPVAAPRARSDAGAMPPAHEALATAVPELAELEAPAAPDLDAANQPAGSHPPPATGDGPGPPDAPAGPARGLNGSVSPDAPPNDASRTDPAFGAADIAALPTAPAKEASSSPQFDPVLAPEASTAPTSVEPVSEAAMPELAIENAPSTAATPTGTGSSATIEVHRDFDPVGAITGAVGSIASNVGGAAASVLDAVKGQLSSLVGGLSSGWDALQSAVGQIVGSITGAVSSGVQTVVGLGTRAGASLQAGFQRASHTISDAGRALMGMVTRGIGQLGGAASAMKSALLAMDGQGLRAAYRRLTDMLGGVFSALQKGREALTTQVSALWGGLERGFSTTIATVRAQADAIGKRLGAAAEAAGARLSGLWDGLRKRAEGMSGIAGAAARLVRRRRPSKQSIRQPSRPRSTSSITSSTKRRMASRPGSPPRSRSTLASRGMSRAHTIPRPENW
jgi:hypothetical protein